MTAIFVPCPTVAEPEDVLDDGTPEERLIAALRVHGADLLEYAGQFTAEKRAGDGTISFWLYRDITRAIDRLSKARSTYLEETDV